MSIAKDDNLRYGSLKRSMKIGDRSHSIVQSNCWDEPERHEIFSESSFKTDQPQGSYGEVDFYENISSSRITQKPFV